MDEFERSLRRGAEDLRRDTRASLDLDEELAATLDRAATIASTSPLPTRPPRNPRHLALAAAAAIVVVAVGGIIVLTQSDGNSVLTPSESTPAPSPGSSDAPTQSAVPATAAPDSTTPESVVVPSTTIATTTTATTATSALPTSPGGAVDFESPPAALHLRTIGSIPFETRDGEVWIDAAIGDRGVVINQSWAGHVTVVGFDGSTREVAVDGELGSLVHGPGDVVYGLRSGESIDDFAIVAVALGGARRGETVGSRPLSWTTYTELPYASFGHGADGVIDRVRGVNTTVIPYVGEHGEAVTWIEAEPAVYTTDRSLVTASTGQSWQLEIHASPAGADSFVGPTPAAPSNDGLAVYWTYIGPNARPDIDFGEPTMPMLAALHPDGTVQWWSVPDGWQVVATDVWGTVLSRVDGGQLQLALADLTPAPASPSATCASDEAPEFVADGFLDAMIAAREAGGSTLVAGCLDEVPVVFTGEVPACWTACPGATRTFAREAATTSEGVQPDGTAQWYTSLPVSYRTADGFFDVWESWQLQRGADGYEISNYSVMEPPFDREHSLATIVEYLGHIERGEWLAAADMLDDGALEPEARTDIQQLGLTEFTTEAIAQGLERWCQPGCDTVAPTAGELSFGFGFSLVRGGEAIGASWFEGVYSIHGLPFRLDS